MRLPIAALWLSDELRRLWQSSGQWRFDHANSFSILKPAQAEFGRAAAAPIKPPAGEVQNASGIC
jgi:hypothetical protein